MDRSKLKRLGVLWVIAAGISVLPVGVARAADNLKIRWDLISVAFTNPPTLSPGGHASASNTKDGTSITMTGSGTFSSNSGKPQNVNGGGTWETFAKNGSMTGSGTYEVTRFVKFALAPVTGPPTFNDTICSDCEVHSALAVLAIEYSDGSEGVLVVSCAASPGTPPSVFEGITATKDFVDYWEPGEHLPGVDANFTAIHILQ